MKQAAWFTYYAKPPKRGRKVRFFRDSQGIFVVDFEGYPILTRFTTYPAKAVATFASYRDAAAKGWGASEVHWGAYEEYAQYWPEDAIPWDKRI